MLGHVAQHFGGADRPRRAPREILLKGARARPVAMQAGLRRRRPARQRDRHAVAGEARDHRRLIADPIDARLGRPRPPAIRHAGNRLPIERPAADPLGQRRRLAQQRREQRLAPLAHPRLRHREAKIHAAVLLQQQPGIAAVVEVQLDRPGEFARRRRPKA